MAEVLLKNLVKKFDDIIAVNNVSLKIADQEFVWTGEYRQIEIAGLTADKGDRLVPDKFTLAQNQPNPFNPQTRVGFSLPTASAVTIEIFNIAGQKVKTLIDGYYEAGEHYVTWDGRDQSGTRTASGIYLYRMKAGSFEETRKMLLIK